MDPRRARHPVHAHGAITAPIVRSSTFTYPSAQEGAARFDGEPGLLYSRLSNPTVRALEEHLARLEGGEDAVAVASGMAAIHTTLMAHLGPGQRVVVDPCVYGCTWSLFQRLASWGVDVVAVDTTDQHVLAEAVADGVAMVFLESPMNPTLGLVDLARAAALTHDAGGLFVVDNTFATPLGQSPLTLGADLVVHSLTKAVAGHSDLLAGAVVGSRELLEPVRGWVKDAGPVLDAETAWLALRGAQTLDVRFERMTRTALQIATALEAASHRVTHPLLASHPQHELAKRQLPHGVSVLTVDLGTRAAAMRFLDGLEIFQSAVSLGGVESLASHPASTTHACMSQEARSAAGIRDGLVRLSIGIEPCHTLLADIEQALAAVAVPLTQAVARQA